MPFIEPAVPGPECLVSASTCHSLHSFFLRSLRAIHAPQQTDPEGHPTTLLLALASHHRQHRCISTPALATACNVPAYLDFTGHHGLSALGVSVWLGHYVCALELMKVGADFWQVFQVNPDDSQMPKVRGRLPHTGTQPQWRRQQETFARQDIGNEMLDGCNWSQCVLLSCLCVSRE